MLGLPEPAHALPGVSVSYADETSRIWAEYDEASSLRRSARPRLLGHSADALRGGGLVRPAIALAAELEHLMTGRLITISRPTLQEVMRSL